MNLRFRDGSIYQSIATDPQGVAEFNEVFPFFNWLVAEVDFARFKATGATVVVDNGGPVPPHNGWTMPSWNQLNPQPQFDTDPVTGAATHDAADRAGRQQPVAHRDRPGAAAGHADSSSARPTSSSGARPTTRPARTAASPASSTTRTTRAEDDPRYAAAENWEPGIPRVQVNLYRDCDNDGKIDQPDAAGAGCLGAQLARAYVRRSPTWTTIPFGWSDGSGAKGPEDVKRNAARRLTARAMPCDVGTGPTAGTTTCPPAARARPSSPTA